MSSSLPTPEDLSTRVRQIRDAIGDLPAAQGLKVLGIALEEIGGGLQVSEEGQRRIAPLPPVLGPLPGPGRRSKVEKDPELQDFVHSFAAGDSIDKVLEGCRRRFGDQRTPSRSALGRYIKRRREQVR